MKIKIILIIILISVGPVNSISTSDSSIVIDGVDSFISEWDTRLLSGGSSISTNVILPLESDGIYDFTVNWGDGSAIDTIDSYGHINNNHSYTVEGIYTVTIDGQIDGWQFDFGGDRLKIIEISQWGSLKLGNSGSYFSGCENLVLTATDTLDLSETTILYRMFHFCENLGDSGVINNWDVTTITDMEYMFQYAISFNQDIGDWDVSAVTEMNGMFYGASAFNQDIGDWDVSAVTGMNGMFQGASAFNQNIGNWNVSIVSNMQAMFSGASAFNQNIGSWDVSSVIYLLQMFEDAISFNYNIDNWDVSNVIWATSMFENATSYNQPLNSWDVSSVTTMRLMFHGATSFNQPLDNWDVSNLQFTNYMFEDAASYNQPLNSWDVSSVFDMSNMFSGASSFDQPLDNWDVSSVILMINMFNGTSSFDQTLAYCNVSSVTDMSDMFKGVSVTNYSDLLINWAKLPLQSSVNFDAGASKFSIAALSSRDYIIDQFQWIITDKGLIYLPDRPEFVSATLTENNIEIKWSEPVNDEELIIEYQIYRATDQEDFLLIGTSESLSFTDTDSNLGHTYYYMVRSVNQDGISEASNVVEVDRVLPEIISQESDLSYEVGSTGNDIKWNVGDDNPDVYNVTKDGILFFLTSYWSNGIIVVGIDGLGIGTYNFTIYLYDDMGNMNSDSVTVEVTEVISEYTSNTDASINTNSDISSSTNTEESPPNFALMVMILMVLPVINKLKRKK